MISGWLVFAFIALLLWGASGVTQKLATNHISSQLSFLWFSCAMLGIAIILVIAVQIQWHSRPFIMGLCMVGGLLNGLGALTSFSALECGGRASVVISLVSLYPLLTVAIAVIFLHEKLVPLQVVGIVLAIGAAILLSLETPSPPATIVADGQGSNASD